MVLSHEKKLVNQEVKLISTTEAYRKHQEVFERSFALLLKLNDIGIYNLRTLELALEGEQALIKTANLQPLATAVKELRSEIPNVSLFILLEAIQQISQAEFNENDIDENEYNKGFKYSEQHINETYWSPELVDKCLRIHSLVIGSSRDITFSLDFIFPEVSPSYGLSCRVLILDKSLKKNPVVAEKSFVISQVNAEKTHQGDLFLRETVNLKGRSGTNYEKYQIKLVVIDQRSKKVMFTRATN